ncbi:hypothetical protein GF360_01735 [candidate division WWE3 bacterium]|nr:hypothetical protein [candidate division WWE3 bacterium]
MCKDILNAYTDFETLQRQNKITLNVKTPNVWKVTLLLHILLDERKTPKSLVVPEGKSTSKLITSLEIDKLIRCEFASRYSQEKDRNFQKVSHCPTSDVFNARLGNFYQIYQNWGIKKDDASRITALLGELGNNVFDHNLGMWPTGNIGCIIFGKNDPKQKMLEIVVMDFGVGFKKSLSSVFPKIKDDLAAIEKGLQGISGRVGETRGNGLKLIQKWTLNNFSGNLVIHSGAGLAIVSKKRMVKRKVPKITGTIVKLMLFYN